MRGRRRGAGVPARRGGVVMTRRLSKWSKPGEKPPMVGVWETRSPEFDNVFFQHWNGKFYGLCSDTPHDAYEGRHIRSMRTLKYACFRGLADKPE